MNLGFRMFLNINNHTINTPRAANTHDVNYCPGLTSIFHVRNKTSIVNTKAAKGRSGYLYKGFSIGFLRRVTLFTAYIVHEPVTPSTQSYIMTGSVNLQTKKLLYKIRGTLKQYNRLSIPIRKL